MNGTTNYMLCKMEDEGSSYGDALKEAQALGFAEADPTADVEGHDVQARPFSHAISYLVLLLNTICLTLYPC